MAFLELHYYSKALRMNTTVNVILPEVHKKSEGVGATAGKYKTLYLLHGLSGDQADWMRKTSIERYAAQYGIAVVMPAVGRTWYTDTAYGAAVFTFVTEELPTVCRSYFCGMSEAREDNYIAGLSMGGYGALKAALRCPDKYCGCASLSGSLDITRKNRPVNMEEWQSIFDFELKSPLELENGEHDLYHIARQNAADGIRFPRLYMWCGTEDGLIYVNRTYHEMLDELGVEHRYEESEGDHTWKWWDKHIRDALKYLFE